MLLHRDRPASDVGERVVSLPEEEVRKPWRVLLHNDDVTPAEYVVKVLEEVFGLGTLKATWVMLRAHVTGVAVVGLYEPEEARRRVELAHSRARSDSWPLHLSCEPST